MFALSIQAQTKVYGINFSDSTVDKSNYIYINQSSGKIFVCMDCTEGHEELKCVSLYPYSSTIIEIISNKVYAFVKDFHRDEKTKIMKEDLVESKILIGYLTADKKIINLRNEVSRDEATAFYIRGNKIYNSLNQVIRQFEGEEVWAAASIIYSASR
jgi:Zn-finger protein